MTRKPQYAARRRGKYGAVPTVIDGIRFASKAEARRYQELRLLEKAGEIHGLALQPRFPLVVTVCGDIIDGGRVGEYRGDFEYCACRRGSKCERTRIVVEDVKGYDTPLSRWKRKHAEIQYGMHILVVEVT